MISVVTDNRCRYYLSIRLELPELGITRSMKVPVATYWSRKRDVFQDLYPGDVVCADDPIAYVVYDTGTDMEHGTHKLRSSGRETIL